MRLALASDHAGFALKRDLIATLKGWNHEVADLGAYDEAPSDYPDFAAKLGAEVAAGRCQRGILICGSGVGASVAVNKVVGIRAAVCHDTYSAHQGVEHDDMNVLVLGSRIVAIELAKELAHAFLGAVFSNEERHRRRLQKVLAMERGDKR